MSSVVKNQRDLLQARMKEIIISAEIISPETFALERELHGKKWFDYCFMSPCQATKLFAEAYVHAYRAAWRQHFDRDEAAKRKGLLRMPSFSRPALDAKERQVWTSLWCARLFADDLGVPYDLFCRVAFKFWLDHGPTRLPQPNQLYSGKWAVGIRDAVLAEWRETCTHNTRWTSLGQYNIDANCSTLAGARHAEWCVGVLKQKHARPFQIADIVYGCRFIPNAMADAAFGADRMEAVNAEPVMASAADVSALRQYDFAPSCATVPHAFDSRSEQCQACHFSENCSKAQPWVLRKIIERHGSIDPVNARKKSQTRDRVAKHRARTKARGSTEISVPPTHGASSSSTAA
ncbi:hypothetical protein [Bosea beijingensis]